MTKKKKLSVIVGHNLTQRVSIKIRIIADVEKIVSGLVDKGVNSININNIGFVLLDKKREEPLLELELRK